MLDELSQKDARGHPPLTCAPLHAGGTVFPIFHLSFSPTLGPEVIRTTRPPFHEGKLTSPLWEAICSCSRFPHLSCLSAIHSPSHSLAHCSFVLFRRCGPPFAETLWVFYYSALSRPIPTRIGWLAWLGFYNVLVLVLALVPARHLASPFRIYVPIALLQPPGVLLHS